jgi:hypothetical protein
LFISATLGWYLYVFLPCAPRLPSCARRIMPSLGHICSNPPCRVGVGAGGWGSTACTESAAGMPVLPSPAYRVRVGAGGWGSICGAGGIAAACCLCRRSSFLPRIKTDWNAIPSRSPKSGCRAAMRQAMSRALICAAPSLASHSALLSSAGVPCQNGSSLSSAFRAPGNGLLS